MEQRVNGGKTTNGCSTAQAEEMQKNCGIGDSSDVVKLSSGNGRDHEVMVGGKLEILSGLETTISGTQRPQARKE